MEEGVDGWNNEWMSTSSKGMILLKYYYFYQQQEKKHAYVSLELNQIFLFIFLLKMHLDWV